MASRKQEETGNSSWAAHDLTNLILSLAPLKPSHRLLRKKKEYISKYQY